MELPVVVPDVSLLGSLEPEGGGGFEVNDGVLENPVNMSLYLPPSYGKGHFLLHVRQAIVLENMN